MVIFKMKYDGLLRTLTFLILIAVVGVIIYFFMYSSGGYLPAWLTLLSGSIAFLILLSSPRKVIVSQHYLELHSLLKLRLIPLKDINYIGLTSGKKQRPYIPLFALWGLFGYFGVYFSLRKFRVFRLFATQRRLMVEVRYHSGKKRILLGVTETRKLYKLLK
ncbi:MAG: hypothetical protein R3Y49_06095 [Rikenellaceae bacterium]